MHNVNGALARISGDEGLLRHRQPCIGIRRRLDEEFKADDCGIPVQRFVMWMGRSAHFFVSVGRY